MSMFSAKWIEGVTAEQPLSEVARQTLTVRLELVWFYLPLAATAAEEDPEHVHQLRVATRRATAAINVFYDLLPERRRASIVKWLKRVRRAAGPARDDDVLAARLAAKANGDAESGAAHLLVQVLAARKQAQQAIIEVHEQLRDRNFPFRVAKLVSKVQWRAGVPEPTFGQDARAALANHVIDLKSAAEADLSDSVTLHQLRIAGKHLRYAMEIFAAAFDPPFRDEIYPKVEHLQDLLGQVNDHATACRRFEAWLQDTTDDAQSSAALESMIAEEQAAIAESQRTFFKWWLIDNGASVLHDFDRYLG